MKLQANEWDISHLHDHLQWAAELEAWTIPYYMSAMFSIVSRADPAYQLIQSVVHQEMLHLQLVANVANAYGYRPDRPFLDAKRFSYDPLETIPHLNFDLDPGHPTNTFRPRCAGIGPLDDPRINTMCLIEYPSWSTGAEQPVLCDTRTEYGSIGELYDALEYGATQLASEIKGGVRQVDMFSAFYRRLPQVKVESSGREGLAQVRLLIDVIRDQGEAAKADDHIHPPHRNTADDLHPECSHFEKFCQIRGLLPCLPETYQPKAYADYTDDDYKLQQILVDNFRGSDHKRGGSDHKRGFIDALNDLLAGGHPDDFVPLMVTIGGNILACWKNGVIPKFYAPPKST